MSYSFMFTILAAEIGLVAGFWFCVGSIFTSTDTIAELAWGHWDYSVKHADVIIAQSAQYSIGAPLLVFSFIFQILGAILPSSIVAWLPEQNYIQIAFFLIFLIVVWGLSFMAYKHLKALKGGRVHALLQKQLAEAEQPAQTP